MPNKLMGDATVHGEQHSMPLVMEDFILREFAVAQFVTLDDADVILLARRILAAEQFSTSIMIYDVLDERHQCDQHRLFHTIKPIVTPFLDLCDGIHQCTCAGRHHVPQITFAIIMRDFVYRRNDIRTADTLDKAMNVRRHDCDKPEVLQHGPMVPSVHVGNKLLVGFFGDAVLGLVTNPTAEFDMFLRVGIVQFLCVWLNTSVHFMVLLYQSKSLGVVFLLPR